ncbi:hypothetical protein DPMN_174003 [Dreissena polymorpha]|uniref:Uncharacterized protein n=1 Tax=Dreissena polymorpha TaxID=45954 RepID=A0A9D4E5E9_DREPO|nr:hypothetical protein DPMN_174003 [Dreissena polymorpha]
MVIPAGIRVHPIGSTSCSMVPSHEHRKPGTNSAWGRFTRCHRHYNPFTFLFLGRPPTHKMIRPAECHSRPAADVPSHPRKYIDYLSDPNAPFESKEGAFAMQRTLKPLRPSRPMHPEEIFDYLSDPMPLS